MKLIKKVHLYFKEGNSDKIYEADLCEVGTNQYVVNFRYGRREAAKLSEGTKTTTPVDLAKAEKVFNALVDEKVSKGYKKALLDGEEEPQPATKAPLVIDDSRRKEAILERLRAYISTGEPIANKKNWRIERVVWRAGELRLKESLPLVVQILFAANNDLLSHSAIWAIGRSGENSHDIDALNGLKLKVNALSFKRKTYALQAFMMIAAKGSEERKEMLAQLVNSLPAGFQHPAQEKNWEKVTNLVKEYLTNRPKSNFDFIETLYILSQEYRGLRPAVNYFIDNAPLKPNFFKVFRHLFKAAELACEPEVFGKTHRRFLKENFFFKNNPYGGSVYIQNANGKYESINQAKEEIKKENSRLAFSDSTKQYLKRRGLDTLLTLTENNEATNYVRMATGVLLAFDETTDKDKGVYQYKYEYDAKTRKYTYYQIKSREYGTYNTYFYILFGNDKKYKMSASSQIWTYDTRNEKNPVPERAEMHPEYWDAMPQAYIHLLLEAKVREVAEFALNRFKKHPQYNELLAHFDISLMKKLIQHRSAYVSSFGLEMVKKIYDPKKPDTELILLLMESPVGENRKQGLTWASEAYHLILSDSDLVFRFLTHEVRDIVLWIRKEMPIAVQYQNTDQRRIFVGRILSYIMGLAADPVQQRASSGTPHPNTTMFHKDKKEQAPKETISFAGANEQRAYELLEILKANYNDLLPNLGIQVIMDLLHHRIMLVRQFAAQWMFLNRNSLPFEAAKELLESTEADIRQYGIHILQQKSDSELQAHKEFFLQRINHQRLELRTIAQAQVIRLISLEETFAERTLGFCLACLMRKENYEGLHTEILEFTKNHLESYFDRIERKTVFKLLNTEYVPANNLAAILIQKYVTAESLSVRNIIRLAEHEVLAVRQTAWRMFEENTPRMRYEREEALRLLDVKWDDSRQFAIHYFRTNFTDRDWTPDILIGICDSVRTDIQALGRELVTRFFKEENGEEYMLRLAQHPKPELQLFVTNYLERYASGNIQHIESLELYFTTVLLHVKKARVAKDRILLFLHKEALQNEKIATMVIRILERLSLTTGIEDRAACISILTDIQAKYPNLKNIIHVE